MKQKNSLQQIFLVCFVVSGFILICSCKVDEPSSFDKTSFTTGRQPYEQPHSQYPQPYAAPYYHPNSKVYSDPYAQYPQQNYHPYYDSDYYYVPPSSYRNIEPSYGGSGPDVKQ